MAKAEEKVSPNIPFRTRFHAWWIGVDPESLVEHQEYEGDNDSSPEAIHIDPEPEVEEEVEYWNPERIAFLTRLWGGPEMEEVILPGGIEYNINLANPMALDESKTVLDLAASLGGPTRALAKEFNVWIEGMESDEDLAKKAQELSVKVGMERRAPIRGFDPDTVELKKARYDAILLRESIFKFRRKDLFIKQVYDAMKPSGHLMLTDYVLKNSSSADSKEVRKWLDLQDPRPTLWSFDEWKHNIVKTRMNLHIHEDRTEEYRMMALTAWANYMGQLDADNLNRQRVNMLMETAQYWMSLIRAMEAGHIKFMRIHGTKGGESIL